MPKVTLPTGEVIDLDLSAITQDDGSPLVTSTPLAAGEKFFSQADVDARIEAARQQEKDKLYGRLETTTNELTALREQVGTLTAAQQAEQERLEAEQARLAAEARAAEEQEMDARTLIQRQREEFDSRFQSLDQQWSERIEQERLAREAAEATLAKDREFSALQQYTQQAVAARADEIAPELLDFIGGNTQAEVDASIERAAAKSAEIAANIAAQLGEQPAPQTPVYVQQTPPPLPGVPASPGTRVTAAPGQDPGATYQNLTAEQIAAMPMAEYAKLRPRIGVGGGQSRNAGMFG